MRVLRLVPLLYTLFALIRGDDGAEITRLTKGSARLVQGTPTPTPTPVRPAIPAPKRAPSIFFGPPELSHLANFCFSFLESSYRFEFCPFNVTTQMTSTAGYVIGIFDSWKSISQQLYTDGSPCGDKKNRMLTVNFECPVSTGNGAVASPETLNSFTWKEPSTCEYEMIARITDFCAVNMTNWLQLYSTYNTTSIAVEPINVHPALAATLPDTSQKSSPSPIKGLLVIELEQRILSLEAELLRCKSSNGGSIEAAPPTTRYQDTRQRKYDAYNPIRT